MEFEQTWRLEPKWLQSVVVVVVVVVVAAAAVVVVDDDVVVSERVFNVCISTT